MTLPFFIRCLIEGITPGDSSELGEDHYSISMSYTKSPSIFGAFSKYPRGYNCSFDAFVWSRNYGEALTRAREKWMEQERRYKANGVKGRVPVHKEGMWHDPG